MTHSPASLNHRARGLMVDYALGAAVVALLPIPYSIFFKIIALPVLLGLMVRGILRLWQGYTPDVVAKLSLLAGLTGAVLLGVASGFVGIVLGVRVPWLAGLAPGLAFFALFWGVGQAVNHCYLSALSPTSSASPASPASPATSIAPVPEEDNPHET
ncbi:MAG: hypothetical protein ACHWZW_06475 [Spirulina sp.]